MKNYDLSLKDILSGIEKSFVKAFLNFDIKNAEALNIEFPKIEEKMADYVCKIEDLKNDKSILHIEFQTTNHQTMHIRMARYLIELYHRYNLPVIQVVIYLGKEKLKMKNEINFKSVETKIEYKYKIVDIKKVECDKFLNSNESDLVVLAILCNFKDKDKSKIVREILQRIDKLNLNDELQKRNYILKLEVLSKLRNLEEIVAKEEEMLEAIKIEDLPSYKKGELKGIEKGKEEGVKKEKLHIAINMLKANIDINDIALFTELSIKEIEELKNLK